VLIINSIPEDISTFRVCQWLESYGVDYIVLDDEFVKVEINEDGCTHIDLGIFHPSFRLDQITAHWFRRGGFNTYSTPNPIQAQQKRGWIALQRQEDGAVLADVLNNQMLSRPHLDSAGRANVNKLLVNSMAKQLGLNVPPYILTSNLDKIIRFIESHGRVVVKPYTPGFYTDGSLRCLTKELTLEDINRLENSIGPTFVQKLIPKLFDIRSFFIEGKAYSTAIFSQQNTRTAVDFRNYDTDYPNRQIPYILPRDVVHQTNELITHLGLHTCSVDFMFDPLEGVVFLEVNPVGQFGPVSYWGNYALEMKIANQLSQPTQ
jgi:ATP-GRASP peptide maturase of grasp-with-spasm system